MRKKRWKCSGCGHVSTDARIKHSCKGYCHDPSGKGCNAVPCPECGAVHYWTGHGWVDEELDLLRKLEELHREIRQERRFRLHVFTAPGQSTPDAYYAQGRIRSCEEEIDRVMDKLDALRNRERRAS